MSSKRVKTLPTPKMIRLYHSLVELWGEPTDLFIFDAQELDHPVNLPLIHVPCWGADEHCEVTTLNTLGMSEQQMQGASYYTELHIAVRDNLTEEERLNLARLLANVAEYPFQYGLKLDWWEAIREVGHIPGFPGCSHLLLHPRLTEEGMDEIADEDDPVRLLYVVPITPFERHLLVEHGREAFLNHIMEQDIDLLADRQDDPDWKGTTI